ncbi:type II toxin-antitoxin system RelE/ParE family toxin [Acaryochloris sp. IP29b_bin.148]|uniref:type II toxin-antitoxin system RelE/ParE family toxin n=1 Tax=Acaryochloris sp. IP29b_bin.148 TaxID=2969218 RepID=UPI00262D1A7B|nr:type II toxin-antitoxin system RelE/ParE family toxin [Acaryochloris sp. IP29b_bin.148]
MSQQNWDLQKYVTPTGQCPFDEWFRTLDLQTQARIDVRLDRVKLGNFGDHKSVGEGIYELRFFFGPGYRIYFGRLQGQIVLLLVGGSKKQQNKDVKAAQKLWITYQDELRGK